MEIRNIETIISNAVTLGMIQFRNSLHPETDRMKQREVARYLTGIGFKPSVLGAWVDAGLVHRRKDGERNATVWYSFAEVQKAVLVARVKENDV